MNKVFIGVLVILMINQAPFMNWDPNYRLEWSDFKGEAITGTQVAAVTSSGITFGFSSKKTARKLVSFDYYVISHFYPNQSWYIKDRANKVILEHERLHFDITELYARKFRQRIENTKFTVNIDREMKQLHDGINAELKAYQERYDDETEHSINVKAQEAWNKKIALELKKLSYYQY